MGGGISLGEGSEDVISSLRVVDSRIRCVLVRCKVCNVPFFPSYG